MMFLHGGDGKFLYNLIIFRGKESLKKVNNLKNLSLKSNRINNPNYFQFIKSKMFLIIISPNLTLIDIPVDTNIWYLYQPKTLIDLFIIEVNVEVHCIWGIFGTYSDSKGGEVDVVHEYYGWLATEFTLERGDYCYASGCYCYAGLDYVDLDEVEDHPSVKLLGG